METTPDADVDLLTRAPRTGEHVFSSHHSRRTACPATNSLSSTVVDARSRAPLPPWPSRSYASRRTPSNSCSFTHTRTHATGVDGTHISRNTNGGGSNTPERPWPFPLGTLARAAPGLPSQSHSHRLGRQSRAAGNAHNTNHMQTAELAAKNTVAFAERESPHASVFLWCPANHTTPR